MSARTHPPGGGWLKAVLSAAGVAGPDPCPVCGGPMTARRGVALTGEQFCDRHLGQEHCALCAMPADASGLAIALCRRCAATSIRTPDDVRRELPAVRQQLAALGIRTVTPVKVQLASAESLERIVGHNALGATISRDTRVTDLLIRKDLPQLKFGTTVAHEVMHTYMAQHGFKDVPSDVAEGLCQLLAFAWIKRQDGILAEAERRQITENPDPIYGDGFRRVRDAALRVGVRRTLAVVRQQHRLP